MTPDIEAALLADIDDHGVVQDSGDYAQAKGIEHGQLVEIIKSLVATDIIATEVLGCWLSDLVGMPRRVPRLAVMDQPEKWESL